MTSVTGRWRITEMDMWDREAIDLVQPGFFEFTDDGFGSVAGVRAAIMAGLWEACGCRRPGRGAVSPYPRYFFPDGPSLRQPASQGG